MNCKTVRKYLFAFADGQLGVQANCEVLDHLKMCPPCSKIVDEHQAVRSKLRFSAEQIQVPPLLEGRVRKAIQLGRTVKEDTRRPRAKNRIFRIVALAACITLIVTGTWYFGQWGNPIGNNNSFSSNRGLNIAQSTALKVRKLHVLCSRKCDGAGHHHESLPSDRESVVKAIRSQYNGELLAVAPDLSGYGFEFESANFCSPAGSDNDVSAHAMYVDYANGNRFSLFSVPHWDVIDQCGKNTPDRKNPFIHSVSQCDDTWVLAWHENGMTYICCGLVDPEKLLSMVSDMQIAKNDVERYDAFADRGRP